MNSQVVCSAEGKINTKLRRQADLKKKSKSSTPEVAKYRTNSTKEDLCHEFISNLSSQFLQIYPKRKAPYMIAENEYGVRKFVSTAIKPTQVPFQELYDLHECASFIAGYIQYEPLDPPYEPPSCLFSPTETLSSNIGDSFDIANLLVSFFLGDGYDAYVVYGYAPKFIALKDQSMTMCPMISGPKATPKVMIIVSDDSNTSNEVMKQEDTQYNIVNNAVRPSQFLKEKHDAEVLAAQDTFQLWIQETLGTGRRPFTANRSINSPRRSNNQREDMESNTDIYVHAWVMIAPGRRDVKETMFVEPSTGRIYNVTNNPYLGIEAVWNHVNYWINLALEKPVNGLDFDFVNGQVWESVFIDANIVRNKDTISHDQPHTHSGHGTNRYNDPNIYQAGPVAITISRALDCPPSYVNSISFTRNQYLTRYPPNGKRTIQYYCSKVDYYSRGNHSQSMVMRITNYLDQSCTFVTEIHEWFEHRKDKLYKRSRYFINEFHTIEYYHPGSIGEIKQWTEYPGKRVVIDYYVDGNLERLRQRDEIIGEKVIEYFDGRTDRLIQRIVEYSVDKKLIGNRSFPLPGNGLNKEHYVITMLQIYENDMTVTSDKNIYQCYYSIPDGKLVVKYHFNVGSITNDIKTYYHTRVGLSNATALPYVNEINLSQEIGLDDNIDRLQEASLLERECYTSIRSSFQSFYDIVTKRYQNELQVRYEYTVYEQAIDKVDDVVMNSHSNNNLNNSTSITSKNQNSLKSIDYLTPYLRNVKDIHNITREEALEIRQNCLDGLKSRLIERANIIQSRLNDENIKLGRKQEQFQRSQREGDFSTEEYEKYCTEAMFRIQILEKRLVDHEEASLKKFAELDAKLASDSRLKVLKL